MLNGCFCRNLRFSTGETGSITLENSSVYPFNNSVRSVGLKKPRDTTDYTVDVYVVSAEGSVGNVTVTDKLCNGFKIAFTGGAKSATIKYVIRGGAV